MMIPIEKLERECNELDRLSDYDPSLDDVVSGFRKAINIVKQHSQEVCNWKCNIDTDAWGESSDCGDYSSDCGLEWNISNDDSPSENEMNFCPKCGRKLVEIKPPSEVQDDKPSD